MARTSPTETDQLQELQHSNLCYSSSCQSGSADRALSSPYSQSVCVFLFTTMTAVGKTKSFFSSIFPSCKAGQEIRLGVWLLVLFFIQPSVLAQNQSQRHGQVLFIFFLFLLKWVHKVRRWNRHTHAHNTHTKDVKQTQHKRPEYCKSF